jgi:cation diffusion facilitator family transporter
MEDNNVVYDRFKRIIKVSIIGIISNLLLGLLKVVAGMLSNSIAILSDAVNNFSDSVSSIVTIVTMMIASKGATKKPPFGFGRVEYFSGAIISVIVIITGVQFLTSSVDRIINPAETNYSVLTLVILTISVISKIVLGRYTKSAGEKDNAPPLIASGEDALSDAIITGVTLICAIFSMLTSINIDGYLGVFVSIVVLKAGGEMLWDIVSSLLGKQNDIELAQKITSELKGYDGIYGAYDLILHNYGPNIYIGNCNVELQDKMTIREAYALLKPIKNKILEKYGVVIFIGFYSVNTTDERLMDIEKHVKEIALSNPSVLQIHAFTIYEELNIMAFDIVVDFDCKDLNKLEEDVLHEVRKEYSSYKVRATMERDFSFSDKPK